MQTLCTDARAIDALRDEIDQIDDEILALIEKRMALASAIGHAKPAAPGELLLRPAREDAVMARLSERSASLGKRSIEAIWRELMAANLQAQRPVEIALHAPDHPQRLRLMGHARFGSVIPIREMGSPTDALDIARSGKAIAVIEIGESDWWTCLADEPDLAIIDELHEEGGRGAALAIGRLGEDRLSTDRRVAILDRPALAKRLSLGEAVCPIAACGELHLCLVEQVAHLSRRAA